MAPVPKSTFLPAKNRVDARQDQLELRAGKLPDAVNQEVTIESNDL